MYFYHIIFTTTVFLIRCCCRNRDGGVVASNAGCHGLACEGAQVNCVAVQTYLFYHNNHITSLKGKEGCNRVFVWIDP